MSIFKLARVLKTTYQVRMYGVRVRCRCNTYRTPKREPTVPRLKADWLNGDERGESVSG